MTRFVPQLAAPETQDREPSRRCCAKCRRGTLAHGVMPSGYALACDCHKPKWWGDEEFGWA